MILSGTSFPPMTWSTSGYCGNNRTCWRLLMIRHTYIAFRMCGTSSGYPETLKVGNMRSRFVWVHLPPASPICRIINARTAHNWGLSCDEVARVQPIGGGGIPFIWPLYGDQPNEAAMVAQGYA